MSRSDELLETLRQAQRFGFFGNRPVEEAVAHAECFVAALDDLPSGSRVLDLGSGGGLPGLVIADARPDVEVVLLDRRQKRTDFLAMAVRRLGFGHVLIWHRDATDVAREIAEGRLAAFDAVTARGFGPPEGTLRTAVGCLGPGSGCVVISEPPTGDRWPPELLDELEVRVARRDTVIRFERRSIH
jgi:16S rRNA (guanine527-N7)-methyltransferase